MQTARSPFFVTYSVWRALFLREALTRLSAGRAAWLWIFLEPIAQVLLLMFLFGYIYQRMVSGVDGAMFIMTGLLSYQIAKNTASRCMESVRANVALFSYRQVKPIDAVLVRAFLEGMLTTVGSLLILVAASGLGYAVVPDKFFLALSAFGLMWGCGLGLGLVLSVATELVPELRKFFSLIWMPVYLLSAVMYPVAAIPYPHRDWLMFNPFVHGVEIVRAGFFEQYALPHGIDIGYLGMWALVSTALGLALHVRFATRLAAQ